MTKFLTSALTILFVFCSFLGKADLPYSSLIINSPTYSNTVNNAGDIRSVTYEIPIEISMRGFGKFLPATVSSKVIESAFIFAFQNANDPSYDTILTDVTTALSSTDAQIYFDQFVLDNWTTKHFNLKVTLNSSKVNAYYRIHIKSINLSSSFYKFDTVTDFRLINATKGSTGIIAANEKNFQFYPSPVTDKLNIETSLNITEVKIINLNGKTVFEGNEKEIDVMSLPKGIYILQIKSEDTMLTKKFVKN